MESRDEPYTRTHYYATLYTLYPLYSFMTPSAHYLSSVADLILAPVTRKVSSWLAFADFKLVSSLLCALVHPTLSIS